MAKQTSLLNIFGNPRVPNPPPGMSYAAGGKRYGAGRSMPNIGNTSAQGMLGYAQRDNQAKARKDAIMRRLRAQSTGNPMDSSILMGKTGGEF